MVTISGGSDDLIEIDGDISDEIPVAMRVNLVKFSASDGTKGHISFDGEWRITVIDEGSLFKKVINGNNEEKPHTDPDAKNCAAYSDVLILKDGIEWVRIGRQKFKA